MLTAITKQNGTPRAICSALNGDGSATAAPESQGTSPFQFNSQNPSSTLVASLNGREFLVRVSTPLSPSSVSSDSSSGSQSNPNNQDGADDYSSFSSDDSSYHIPTRPTRASKRRGVGPKGDWKRRAMLIDWLSSKSIESLHPPYPGKRYGQHPFPLHRLLTVDGTIPSPYQCYMRVSDWRRLTPSRQAKEIRSEQDFHDELLKEEGKMEAKMAHASKKARKIAERAAKKAATDARRNENRRNKRRREREEREANARLASEPAGADAEEVSGCLSLYIYISLVFILLLTYHSIYIHQVINSRLLDAPLLAQQSASAQVTKRRSKRRKQNEPVVRQSQLDDRASKRARQTLYKYFHRTVQTISAAPGIDTTNFPQEQLMLVHVRENNSRTVRDLTITSSGNNTAVESALFLDMLNDGRFADIHREWLRNNPTAAALTDTNNNGSTLPIVGAAAVGAATVDAAAAAEATTTDSDGEDEQSCDSDNLLPELPLPLTDDAAIPFSNSQNAFDYLFNEDN